MTLFGIYLNISAVIGADLCDLLQITKTLVIYMSKDVHGIIFYGIDVGTRGAFNDAFGRTFACFIIKIVPKHDVIGIGKARIL